jgi:DNA sulfur modification protein DndB
VNDLKDVQDTTVSSVGFLTLHGDEQLFALDGQHRLAGIKRVISKGVEHSFADEVSVIFVAHLPTKAGLQRTRRLFTTLNKTAKAVSKGDIIALDEDDAMAICVRRLIEDSALFAGERIAFKATNNMPVNNVTALTTIGTLYDVLVVLFTQSHWDGRASRASLSVRPDDKTLKDYFDYAVRYFELLGQNFPELKAFFRASDTSRVVKKHRGPHGGTLMFRPIGLEIMTQVIARLTRDMRLEAAVKRASKLGRDLTQAPYVGLMWDTSRNLITNSHKATLREVLLHMLGRYSKWGDADLVARYRKDAANDRLVLPQRLPG